MKRAPQTKLARIYADAVHDIDDAKIAPSELDNLDATLSMIETAFQVFPDDPVLHRQKGYILAEQEHYEDALPHLLKAVAAVPKDGHLSAAAGYCLYCLRRYDEARPFLERAVKDYPADFVWRMRLGFVQFMQGDRFGAAANISAALKEIDLAEFDEEIRQIVRAGMADWRGQKFSKKRQPE